jgi:tryptophan-rich sensory protein
MVREFILVIISIVVGLALAGWSAYMIWHYYRTPKTERLPVRVYFRIAWLFLLIGLADLGKALGDLVKLIGRMAGEA